MKPSEEIEEAIAKLPARNKLLEYRRGKTQFNIYCLIGRHHPEIMENIGYLRARTYQAMQAASQKPIDIDNRDKNDKKPYRQIIVCQKHTIVAGCRVYSALFTQTKAELEDFATSSFFRFTERFKNEYLPFVMDIGRMFILPHLQGGFLKQRKGSFLLDALFHALARLVKTYNIKFLLGRVMLSPQLSSHTRHAIMAFLQLHHHSKGLVSPKKPSFHLKELQTTLAKMKRKLDATQRFSENHCYNEDHQTMTRIALENRETIPALIRAYLALSPSLHFFGAVRDTDLSSVEEICIMVESKLIYEKYRKRYLN